MPRDEGWTTVILGMLLLAFVLMFAGCSADPVATVKNTNSGVTVEVLTEFEGCTLYRVYAGATPIYVARCGRDDVNTTYSHTRSSGRHRHVVVDRVITAAEGR